MKKLLALILSMLLVASCMAMVVFAADETTEAAAGETTEAAADETTEGAAPSYVNTLLTFNSDAKEWKVISSPNGINKTYYKDEWEGARLLITDAGDPYVTINYQSYVKKGGVEKLDSEAYPFVVFKLKVDGYVDDVELFFCAGSVMGASADYATTTAYPCECSGEVEYIIYDLSGLCDGNYNQFRFDPMGADEDTIIYLYEMAFFATEDEALAYAGYDEEETEAPTTEAPTTEEVTEEETEGTTKAPATPNKVEEDKGCGGIISVGAAVAMVALGVVCIKKKD